MCGTRPWRLAAALFVVLLAGDPGRTEPRPPEPDPDQPQPRTSASDRRRRERIAPGATLGSYRTRKLEGWTVHVHNDLAGGSPDDRKLGARTLELLRVKLYEIARVVPDKPLARLREIPIWVEKNDPRFPCMCYHVSPDWLADHGLDPAKAGAVELANAATFLAWTRDQPWMVLHELAHGYHHRVLTHGHAELRACYQAALAAKSYESVLHIHGQKRRAYALNNDQEYFAEATEAFFGTNDFFPFVRAELRAHDPRLFALLQSVWSPR
jgi:hypothetical protein